MEYDPGTVRRWIGCFNAAGVPVCRTGPAAAGPGWAEAGCPGGSPRFLSGLGRGRCGGSSTTWAAAPEPAHPVSAGAAGGDLAAAKLVARGDPARAAVVAAIVRRLRLLPAGSVIWAAGETHLHLLPHVRSSWTLPTGARTSPPRAPTGN